GPADVDLAKALKAGKENRLVRLGYYEDESFPHCDWHFPLAHYLESWGDALSTDGTLVPVQPLIAPLFGGWTEIEVLARIAGEAEVSAHDVVRKTFVNYAKGNFENEWRKFLYNGFLANSAATPLNLSLDNAAASATAPKAAAPSRDNLDVVFHRDYSVDDGRYSNNGWLQELPDPITKFVWDNAVLLSRKTARELGLRNMDVVEVSVGERKVNGPVWIQPGMADYTLGLALGYGRQWVGRIGHRVGFDAYALRTRAGENLASGAKLRSVGERYPIACTQDHWSM